MDSSEISASVYPRGSVVRIKLKNFLTYDEAEAKPAPGLNLLLGPNGTGKSSIVCALCLGLAGLPSILGRSGTLGDYVKRGQSSAIIEIELSSGNNGQKNPVIKTIYRVGNNANEYFVNNVKKKRDEVREFVKDYHIQVDNLCQFLAQDKVVEFARQSKQDLLLNTEKAAGSVDLYDQHMNLNERFQQGKDLRSKLGEAGKKKTLFQNKLTALEKPYQQYVEYQERRKKLDLLEKKRPWVEYNDSKEELGELKEELDKAKQDYAQRESSLQPLKDEIEAARKKEATADRQLADQLIRLERAKVEFNNDLGMCRRLSEEINRLKREVQNSRDDHQTKTTKLETLKNSIAELRQRLSELQDENLQGVISDTERQIREVNSSLDRIEPHQTEVVGILRREEAKKASIEMQLRRLEDRQGEQLQKLRAIDDNAYRAYAWYKHNQERFQGSVWLPALEMRIPDKRNIKFVEACIGRRDLFAFVFENFDDMQLFLGEMHRQNIKVGGGEVPSDYVETSVTLPSDLRQFGFHDFVCNMFEAPDGLKKYLTKLAGLNKIPVGSDEPERQLERVFNAVRGRYWRLLTSSKQFSISESRYGGAPTTQNTMLREPSILVSTTNTGDESLEHNLKKELEENAMEIARLTELLRKLSDEARELKRQKEALTNQRVELRQRSQQRETLKSQIAYKEKAYKETAALIPDMAEVQNNFNNQLTRKLQEKLAVLRRLAERGKEIEKLFAARSQTCVGRATYSVVVVSKQRAYTEASSKLQNDKQQLERIQADYKEKQRNVDSLLNRARRVIGVAHGTIPDDLKKAFDECPDDLVELDEAIETQQALLHACQDVDKSIVADYKKQQRELQNAELEELHLQQEVTTWEADVAGERQKWLTDLQKLLETISHNFSRFMAVLGCAGEVELEKPENENDFLKYGVKIKVKFRDSEPLRELDQQHQSGGERSVSTMLYMLALQELSHVPFRCVDEINQGMDPVNERKVFEMMTKLLSNSSGALNCTQYFMLTPKLLHDLPMGENVEVWLIHNGMRMLSDDQWDAKKFLRRRQAINSLLA